MIQTLKIRNSSSIGLFLLATDEYCLVPPDLRQKDLELIRKTLDVDIVETTMAGTSLIGLFAAGNSKGVVVPYIVYEDEIDGLKEAGIDVEVIYDTFTALGNLIALNDQGGIASPLLRERNVDKIARFLGIELVQSKVAGNDLPGASIAASNRAFLVHPLEENLDTLKKIFGVEGLGTTVNGGDPFVGTGVVMNSNGTIVGADTTPVELFRIHPLVG